MSICYKVCGSSAFLRGHMNVYWVNINARDSCFVCDIWRNFKSEFDLGSHMRSLKCRFQVRTEISVCSSNKHCQICKLVKKLFENSSRIIFCLIKYALEYHFYIPSTLNVYLHMHMHIYIYIYIYIERERERERKRERKQHTHTHVHTHTHTQTHTHIYIYIYIYMVKDRDPLSFIYR